MSSVAGLRTFKGQMEFKGPLSALTASAMTFPLRDGPNPEGNGTNSDREEKMADPATRMLAPAATASLAVSPLIPPSIWMSRAGKAARRAETFGRTSGRKLWPPNPGLTDITRTCRGGKEGISVHLLTVELIAEVWLDSKQKHSHTGGVQLRFGHASPYRLHQIPQAEKPPRPQSRGRWQDQPYGHGGTSMHDDGAYDRLAW